MDPEVGVSVVDLGPGLRDRIWAARNSVRVEMTMTSPMCPLATRYFRDVELRVKKIKGVAKADVELVWEPAWSPEMMDEEKRMMLGV